MQGDRQIDGRYQAIEKAVQDKAGATVDFKHVTAAFMAFALPVAIGALVMSAA
jgi:hypothetical protein